MKRITFAFLLLLVACGVMPSAWACSIIPREDFLSNYEMVKRADAIVLARASQALPPVEEDGSPRLQFDILRVLKGKYKAKTIESVVGSTDEAHYFGRGPTDDFSQARSGIYAGACSASDCRVQDDYLLFLTQEPIQAYETRSTGEKVGAMKWRLGVQILSRDREEVAGKDDPWTQAVMRYAEIVRLSDYKKEKDALATLRSKAAQRRDVGHFPPPLVNDIDRHFRAASALKSYTDLKALYDAATTERRRDAADYAMAAAKQPEAFDLIYQRFGGATVQYFGAGRDPRSTTVLTEQFLKRKDLMKSGEYQGDARDVATLLAGAAIQRDTPLMMRTSRRRSQRLRESSPRAVVCRPSFAGGNRATTRDCR